MMPRFFTVLPRAHVEEMGLKPSWKTVIAVFLLSGCLGNVENLIPIPVGSAYPESVRTSVDDKEDMDKKDKSKKDKSKKVHPASVDIFDNGHYPVKQVEWSSPLVVKKQIFGEGNKIDKKVGVIEQDGNRIGLVIHRGYALPVKVTDETGKILTAHIPSGTEKYLRFNGKGVADVIRVPFSYIESGTPIIPRLSDEHAGIGEKTLYINGEDSGVKIVNGFLDKSLVLPEGEYIAEIKCLRYGDMGISSVRQKFIVDKVGNASLLSVWGTIPKKGESFVEAKLHVSADKMYKDRSVHLKLVDVDREYIKTGFLNEKGKYTFTREFPGEDVLDGLLEVELSMDSLADPNVYKKSSSTGSGTVYEGGYTPADIETRIEAINKRFVDASRELAVVSQEYDDEKRLESELLAEVNTIQTNLDKFTKMLEDHQGKLETITTDYNDKIQQKLELENSAEKLKTKMEDLTAKLEESNSELEKAKEVLSESKAIKDEKEGVVKVLEKENENLEYYIENAEKYLKQIQDAKSAPDSTEEGEEVSKAKTILTDNLNVFKANLKTYEDKFTAKELELSGLEDPQSKKTLEDEIAILEKNIEKTSTNVKNIEKILSEGESSSDENPYEKVLQDLIKGYKLQKEDLLKNLETANEAFKIANDDFKTKESAKTALDSSITVLETDMDKLKVKLDKANEELSKIGDGYETEKTAITALEASVEVLRTNVESLTIDFDKKTSDLAMVSNSVVTKEEAKKSLEASVVILEKQMDDLAQKLGDE